MIVVIIIVISIVINLLTKWQTTFTWWK